MPRCCSLLHSRSILLVSGALGLALGGCGHDWDGYAPVGVAAGSSNSGAGGTSGVGGTGSGGVAGGVASASSASSTSSGVSSSSTGVGGGDPCAQPIFLDDFSAGMQAWKVDAGTWSVDRAELVQQDDTAGATLVYVPSVSVADQRLEAKTTLVSGAASGAIELVARIDPDDVGDRYWCAFQPSDGWMVIRVEADYLKIAEPVAFQVDLAQTPGYSETASHVMHFDVVGTTLHCWVEGVVGADTTTSDGTYAQGMVGLKTYLKHARFDDFTVCP